MYNALGLFFLSNTTPKSRGMTQLALAYPLDFLEAKKVQRFSFVFADSQYFAWSDLEQYDLTLYH